MLSHRVRHLDWALIALMVAVYAASFRLESAVNGYGEISEIFDQDSRWVLRSLELGIPYEWNAPNHVLYHWLAEGGFSLWKRAFGGGLASAYRFLKLFTAATGAGYLVAFRYLCVQQGLGSLQRCLALVLAGLSVGPWFHFAAFETFGLGLPPLVLLLAAVSARLRARDESRWNHAVIVGCLLVGVWSRTDQVRLWGTLGLLLLHPATKGLRRGLALDLVVFAALAPLGFALLLGDYYDLPLGAALGKASERNDFVDFRARYMLLGNLRYFWRVLRANSIYGVLMPVSEWGSPFGTNVNGFFRRPLSLPALGSVLFLLGHTALQSARKALAGDGYHAFLWASWLGGWVFYTWFNPHEPFLWVAHFAVLFVAALADTWRQERWFTWAVAAAGLLVAAHNFQYFVLRYR